MVSLAFPFAYTLDKGRILAIYLLVFLSASALTGLSAAIRTTGKSVLSMGVLVVPTDRTTVRKSKIFRFFTKLINK